LDTPSYIYFIRFMKRTDKEETDNVNRVCIQIL